YLLYYYLSLLLFLSHAPAPTQIYTLSLHDALPISILEILRDVTFPGRVFDQIDLTRTDGDLLTVAHLELCPAAESNDVLAHRTRSEEHTSELQSRGHLVCRLLLEKKKHNNKK